MTRKKRSITLSISETEKARLEKLALEFEQTWGDKPNVSKLVKAIANGQLRLASYHGWERDRINKLNRVLGWLKDEGHLDEARELARLLLERSKLSDPLRREIQAWVDQPGAAWRIDLERCKQMQRPFRLTYQDAADRILSFTVRHATIERHEDRHYLDCWCDETEGNQDIEALKHNWSLRLDRIPEGALISRAEGTWQPDFSSIEVEFHLLHRLAFAYRTKKGEDVENEWLADRRVRRVVRRVRNTFWFQREILRYGADCIVVRPDVVRDRIAQTVNSIAKHYEG